MDLGLKEKVVMVAASSKGLGYAIARQAALEGARVSMGSRSSNHINDASARIKSEFPEAILYPSVLDVSDPVSIEAWVKDTQKEMGSIYGLVVNGGGPPPGTFDELGDPDWYSGYENTLMSAVRLIRHVLPSMRDSRSGSILTITSSSVKEPIDNLLLSNVYRAGVTSLVKSLSFQLAADGIRINNLVPGYFDTDRLKELDLRHSREWRLSPENVRQINFEAIPMGKYGDPEEFGKVGAFLLSEASSYMTGSTIVIDGGKMRTVW